MSVQVDTTDFNELAKSLRTFAKKAAPFAVRNALTAQAFHCRKVWTWQIQKSMTLRNTFTTRSLQVVKASGFNISTMQSVVGSELGYMKSQEEGDTESKKGKHGVPIPTATAAGMGMKARPRKKQVRKGNYMAALKVGSQKRIGNSQKQRNAIAVKTAAKGTGIAYLDLGKRRGLFRVTGGKRGLKVRMLYDLSRDTIRIKPLHTLQQAVEQTVSVSDRIYSAAVLEQLQRNQVFGYFIGPRRG